MSKILVLFTGGTIGSATANDTIYVDSNTQFLLISEYEKRFGKSALFETVEIYNELSENINLTHIEKLASYINKMNFSDYDGIIITHGSDTLAFSASVLGLLFANVRIPVILVAANYPLADADSNGITNFARAVSYIIEKNTPGVYVSWQNPGEASKLHTAGLLTSANSYSDRFESIDAVDYKEKLSQAITDLTSGKDIILNKNVLCINPYPGLDYSMFDLDKVTAVVHYLYHSSTACTVGESHSLTEFIKHCRTKDIPVYLAPFKSVKGNYYESCKELITAGAVPLSGFTKETAYAYVICKDYISKSFKL